MIFDRNGCVEAGLRFTPEFEVFAKVQIPDNIAQAPETDVITGDVDGIRLLPTEFAFVKLVGTAGFAEAVACAPCSIIEQIAAITFAGVGRCHIHIVIDHTVGAYGFTIDLDGVFLGEMLLAEIAEGVGIGVGAAAVLAFVYSIQAMLKNFYTGTEFLDIVFEAALLGIGRNQKN